MKKKLLYVCLTFIEGKEDVSYPVKSVYNAHSFVRKWKKYNDRYFIRAEVLDLEGNILETFSYSQA